MPQNKIQFQHGMSLSEYIERHGTVERCEQALKRARWPSGFVCPECGGREHSRFLADGRLVHTCARTMPCPKHWLRLADTGPG